MQIVVLLQYILKHFWSFLKVAEVLALRREIPLFNIPSQFHNILHLLGVAWQFQIS